MLSRIERGSENLPCPYKGNPLPLVRVPYGALILTHGRKRDYPVEWGYKHGGHDYG